MRNVVENIGYVLGALGVTFAIAFGLFMALCWLCIILGCILNDPTLLTLGTVLWYTDGAFVFINAYDMMTLGGMFAPWVDLIMTGSVTLL